MPAWDSDARDASAAYFCVLGGSFPLLWGKHNTIKGERDKCLNAPSLILCIGCPPCPLTKHANLQCNEWPSLVQHDAAGLPELTELKLQRS